MTNAIYRRSTPALEVAAVARSQVPPAFVRGEQTSLAEVGDEAWLARLPLAEKRSSTVGPKQYFLLLRIQNIQDFPVPCCKRRHISVGRPAENSLFLDIHR